MAEKQPCLPCRQGRAAILGATVAVRAGDLPEAIRQLGAAASAVKEKTALTSSAVRARIQRL